MKINYGSTEVTKITDQEGSSVTATTHFRAGIPNSPVKIRYRIKRKVSNQTEEHEAYLKFSDEHQKDKTMLDPGWDIEHTRHGDENGYYYVIKSYTRLSYE